MPLVAASAGALAQLAQSAFSAREFKRTLAVPLLVGLLAAPRAHEHATLIEAACALNPSAPLGSAFALWHNGRRAGYAVWRMRLSIPRPLGLRLWLRHCGVYGQGRAFDGSLWPFPVRASVR